MSELPDFEVGQTVLVTPRDNQWGAVTYFGQVGKVIQADTFDACTDPIYWVIMLDGKVINLEADEMTEVLFGLHAVPDLIKEASNE